LVSILQEIGVIESLVIHKDLERLHKLIESAYNTRLIDRKTLRELMLELSEIAKLDGEKLIEKAREFEKRLKGILGCSKELENPSLK